MSGKSDMAEYLALLQKPADAVNALPPELRRLAVGKVKRPVVLMLYAARGRVVSQGMLLGAIYGGDEPEYGHNCLAVALLRLRIGLRGTGWTIRNQWSVGWALEREVADATG